jgi:hypothetical protein
MKLLVSSAILSVLFVASCGSKKPAATSTPPTTDSAGSATATPGTAKEGESCGNGVMGAPNIQCADGLVCDYGAGTAPTAPAGAAASAKPGTCKKK